MQKRWEEDCTHIYSLFGNLSLKKSSTLSLHVLALWPEVEWPVLFAETAHVCRNRTRATHVGAWQSSPENDNANIKMLSPSHATSANRTAAKHQLALRDHGHRASALSGVPDYASAYDRTILIGNRGTWVQMTCPQCPESLRSRTRPGIDLATSWL